MGKPTDKKDLLPKWSAAYRYGNMGVAIFVLFVGLPLLVALHQFRAGPRARWSRTRLATLAQAWLTVASASISLTGMSVADRIDSTAKSYLIQTFPHLPVHPFG